jgi:selenocysteine-specific elongation factor
VVSGIPVSGCAHLGDELVLLPQGLAGRLKGIQAYGQTRETVMAGQCAALNVRQWEHTEIKHGDCVTIPGYFTPQEMYLCKMRVLTHERLTLKNGAQIKFHTGTSVVPATLYLMQGDGIQAGDEALVQVRLTEPIVAGPGDRFIVRTLSPVYTVGGGMIVEAIPRRLKRNRPELQQDVEARAKAVLDEKDFVEYCVKNAESFVASEADISLRTKIPRSRLAEMLNGLIQEQKVISIGSDLYMHHAMAAQGEQLLVKVVEEFHRASPESPGLPVEQAQEKSGLPKVAFDGLLAQMLKDGRLVERNRRLALSGHREAVKDEDVQLLVKIEGVFTARLFNPPSPEEAVEVIKVPRDKVDRAIKMLIERERLVRLPEGLIFHRQAIDRAREITLDFFREKERLESVDFKYLLNTTRKYAIQLLDHMDRIGVTQRIGNTRYLKPQR